MRVFACEHLTGGGFVGAPLPACLTREGDIMLRALVADLAALPGVEVVTARDRRLPDPGLHAEVHWMDPARDPWSAWAALSASCDAVWPIAPESAGALARWCELARSSGCALIASGVEVVALTSSKQRTAAHLSTYGIPVVPTHALTAALAGAADAPRDGWVVKPDVGAGAEDTWLLPTVADLRRWAQNRVAAAHYVVQPFVRGVAASLSLLCLRGRAKLLACNLQDVRVEGGRFRYRGGVVAGCEDRRHRYEPLAAGIAAAIPGLAGYVGVDLIDGPDGPQVLEINARLTTSYAGLRDVLGVNPAAVVLESMSRGVLPDVPLPASEHVVAIDAHAA